MKKVSFLLMAALLGGLLILPACTQKKEIYLQLYSVRDDIKADYTGTIAKVAEMGYTGVETAGYADGQFYGLSPADFKKSIEAVGMEVLSSHTARPLADSVAATNWDEVWAWWDTAIQAHKEAGMKYIVTPWMPTPATLADLQAYCDYYNQIGEKCNAAGLRFGYHNHDFEFKEIEGQLMYDYMLNNTDPSKVFFQMDVYWVVKGGKDPVDYFNNYPGRFELLHIKDELELGRSGEVDFESIYNNAETAGAKYMIVEVERYTEGLTPFESVKESYDFLNDAPYVKASYSK
ncbi:Sugar phosphate isomerase/epimerase [Porphyromonadaceae bacterium KH3CP3RA]|nr:Sugar phosphate isomerase/epimerase [Porphyromonadaceae bacterium KH3CP3RA]